MQKRNNHRATLPLSTQDVTIATSRRVGERRQRRRKCKIGRFKWIGLLVFGVLSLAGLYRWLGHRSNTIKQQQGNDLMDDNAEPLDQFPSLQYALKHSKIVLLYFAASWCPMSTPVTHLIDETLGDLLLPAPNEDNPPPTGLHDLSLVFVSSDRTDADMQQYIRRNWMTVPLVRKKEMGSLKIARKREIPTLIVLAGQSRQVLTYAGIDELKDKGEHVVDHWLRLLEMSDAIKSKYH